MIVKMDNVQMSLSVTVGAATIVGNILLIHASRLQSTGHRFVHWFVTSLGVAGLLGGLVSFLGVIFYLCVGYNSHFLCQLDIWCLQMQQVASVGSVLLIIADRYLLYCSAANYGLNMTLPMASTLLVILWITSGLLAAIVAVNTKASPLGSNTCFLASHDSAVGTHVILLLQLIMMVASVVMCVKLYRHRRNRVNPLQDSRQHVTTERLQEAGGLQSVHLLIMLCTDIFTRCPVIVYTLVYLHMAHLPVNFLLSGELYFGFGWLFLGNAITSYVLALGVPNYNKVFCRMANPCSCLRQAFQSYCRATNNANVLVPRQPALVPVVLTISQLLRDITSARSRMASMVSTAPDRRITTAGLDVNDQLLKRLSTGGPLSVNPSRITVRPDSTVLVSLPPIPENCRQLESIDEEKSLHDDETNLPTNNDLRPKNSKVSIVTFHR